MVNLSPDVFSATTSPQSPTRTSTHETFSRRKSSKALPMNDATAASTRGASSAPVPTMWMNTWFQAVPCCPTASSIDPSTSASTESSSTVDDAPRVWPSRATSTATEPLGVRWCPTPSASAPAAPASSSSFWYTDARRNTRRSRCGSFAPCRDLGTASSARNTPMAYSLGVTKSAARRRPCERDAIMPTHSTWKLARRSTSICDATCGQKPRARATSLNCPSGSSGDPVASPRGPNDRRRSGGFCETPVGDVTEDAGDDGVAGPAAAPGSASAAPTRAKVKCCGAAPTASRDTATRFVLGEMVPARFCPLTNALADSRTSRSSRPCRRGYEMTNDSSSGRSPEASGSAATACPRDGAKSTRFLPPSRRTNVTPGSDSNTSGPAFSICDKTTPDAAKSASMAANFSVSDGASKSDVQSNVPPAPCAKAEGSNVTCAWRFSCASPAEDASAGDSEAFEACRPSSATPRITPLSSARFAYELNRASVLVLSRNSVPTLRRLGRSVGVPPLYPALSVSLVTSLIAPRSSTEPYRDPAEASPKSERLSCLESISDLPPARSMAFMRSRRDLRDSSCFRTMICRAR